MILDTLINIIYGIMWLTFSILPNWSVPSEILNAFNSFTALSLINAFFPVYVFLHCIFLLVSYKLIILTFNAVGSALSIIRGGGNMKL